MTNLHRYRYIYMLCHIYGMTLNVMMTNTQNFIGRTFLYKMWWE